MNFTIENHLLHLDGKQVAFVESPNHGATIVPEYLVEHFTGSVSAAGSISWFKSPSSKVSAHLLIDRDGTVTQFAPFNVKMWHAGQSEWNGVEMLNGHSIGIEHVNAGMLGKHENGDYYSVLDSSKVTDFEVINGHGWQEYTGKQIEVSALIASLLVSTYKLKEIVGHEQIAPGRKIDPGPAFPWDKIRGSVTAPMSGKKTTSILNVRSGPGVDYMSIAKLPLGTPVNVMEERTGWLYIGKGWVSAQYVA